MGLISACVANGDVVPMRTTSIYSCSSFRIISITATYVIIMVVSTVEEGSNCVRVTPRFCLTCGVAVAGQLIGGYLEKQFYVKFTSLYGIDKLFSGSC